MKAGPGILWPKPSRDVIDTKHTYTVAIDWDGVVHNATSGFVAGHIFPDPPVPGAIDAIRHYLGRFDVVIHSCRFHPHGKTGLDLQLDQQQIILSMVDYLTDNGLTEADINGQRGKLKFWTGVGKPLALLYIDDRGFRFVGKFPTIQEIYRLRPWNKT
jgi:hypothetical protein